ncbi:unnamed protein product [Malus baccata var. baccata]
MTRSSNPVHEHILDFDGDFERELRRKRKNPEPSESSASSESVSEYEEEVEDMAADNRTIKELSASGLDNAVPLCYQYPRAAPDKTAEFKLKSSLLHHIPKYHGLSMENPNKHLQEFEVVCSSMTPVNVDESILKMKAFPFSLLEKAKDWLYELAPGTVTSWESMKRAFLEKFFPTSRVILLRKRISGIQQEEGETFPTYYERFKSLVASCPQHQMKEELLLQYFYEGLLPIERQMLDASAGGALVDKTPTAAKMLIYNRALNAQQYEGVEQRSMPQQHQVNEVSAITELQNQMANLTTLLSQVVEGPKVKPVASCGVCSMQNHHTDNCPQLIENGGWETLNAVGYGNQYQSCGDSSDNDKICPQGGTEPQPFKSALKEDEKLQIEEEEQAKATTRIEQPLPQPSKHFNSATLGKEGPIQVNSNVIPPNVPFPSRFLQSNNKEEEKDVLETFRKVHVNIPLLDDIKQIPKYAKFLKKLCTTRKQIREKEVVHVSENVSALLQRKLPPKCKDPGSFTIPCVIGNTRFDHAMLDLGASINVMPYSVYASMNLGKLKNDGVIIQLADRSNAYPKGVFEDVLVQVDHLIFPADFYVLDMEDSTHSPPSPLLLGRPFMKTAQTKIDMAKGAVTMAFGGDMINFKISESVENTNDVRSCCAINVIENIGQECSTLVKKNVPQPTIEEGSGVNNKKCTAPTLKTPNLAECTPCASVHSATTSFPYKGKPPIPMSIPISANRLLPCIVQVPNQSQRGGKVRVDLEKQNMTTRKDHYPIPFKDPKNEVFRRTSCGNTPPCRGVP